jgi:hypothetical protein
MRHWVSHSPVVRLDAHVAVVVLLTKGSTVCDACLIRHFTESHVAVDQSVTITCSRRWIPKANFFAGNLIAVAAFGNLRSDSTQQTTSDRKGKKNRLDSHAS